MSAPGMGSQLGKIVSKSAEEQGRDQPVDRKAGMTERRKTQMKWCEDQRFKLQKEYAQLEEAKQAVNLLFAKHLHESQRLLKMRQNHLKNLSPEMGNGAVPDGAFKDFSQEESSDDNVDSDSDSDNETQSVVELSDNDDECFGKSSSSQNLNRAVKGSCRIAGFPIFSSMQYKSSEEFSDGHSKP